MTDTLTKKVEQFDHVTNEEVLRRIGSKRKIGITLNEKKLEYLGHLLRHSKYRIQGKMDSRRGPKRTRHSWSRNLRQWFALS